MAEIDIDGGVAATTLSGGINSSDTTINVADASGWPPGTTNFYIVIDRGLSAEETIEISGRSGNTLTAATRGADGSSAASHSSGAVVEHVAPASALQEANTHANQTTGTPHGSAYIENTAGAVSTSNLAADAVDGTKIADDAIDSEHYTDGSIDTAHLAADAVDGTKLADNAVDSEHYTDGSIDTVHLAADAVDGTKIADDAIDSEHYTDGSIDTAHLADDAVTTDKVSFGWSSWTPQVYQGANVTATNTRSRYMRIDNLIIVQFHMTVTGSESTGNVKIEIRDLPIAGVNTDSMFGFAYFFDDNLANFYHAFADGLSTTSVEFFAHGDGRVGASPAYTLASNDTIRGTLIYDAA